MNFNEHWNLEGRHSFLSPSQYHWVNYTTDKLIERYFNAEAVKRGTALHEYASMAIKLERKQPRNKDTVNMFVNDALGYMMVSEQPLYYSENCFGTADAISFDKNVLRIHDLKTGVTEASMLQLEVYAAIFCLEYEVDPKDITIELRIYQRNEKRIEIADHEDIREIMRKIVEFDKTIESVKRGSLQ
jgi:hypothetical protein